MINNFRHQYFFLSNFYLIPILYQDIRYPSSEHAYQASKVEDVIVKLHMTNFSAYQAKQLGRTYPPRSDRLIIMEDILRIKFSHKELKEKLLITGHEYLLEGNTWNDRFWGAVLINNKWQGENHLGKILMKIRNDLRKEG